jgi:hypothetical protein
MSGGYHEECLGKSDEWYTPPEYFAALRLVFDLDPCSPGPGHWVPARSVYTKTDDGLSQPWHGCVFMNPPFGGRNGQVPWLRKFFAHGNGIAVVMARTSAGWFHDYASSADTMLFPRGKTKFIRPDGTIGKSPGSGIVMLGAGATACTALHRSKLGICVDLNRQCEAS